ncbi:ribonuclease H family protein [Lapidilactobacillus achengensis]|uniref:Ribonuclease H n=1 Tax=Lapidilactobacillus achengensis TaxID=2486000 RepID=A0ABW1UPB3_9LACO|nr:ribonuclease H family protein [Lapidilactobacillus achengensis]
MARNYYAVLRGRRPGIYTDWEVVKGEVFGFSNARYKSFDTKEAAAAWLTIEADKPATAATSATQSTPSTAKSSTQPDRRPLHLDLDVQDPNIIQVFTDGGSRNTGNKLGQHVKSDDLAAWAYLIILPDGQQFSGSAGETGATNNRMELLALINALEKLQAENLQGNAIQITSDSHYVLDPIRKGWLNNWRQRDWRKSTGKVIANLEAWQQIDHLLTYFSQLNFQWAKGHATNSGNIFVDELLNKTMDEM